MKQCATNDLKAVPHFTFGQRNKRFSRSQTNYRPNDRPGQRRRRTGTLCMRTYCARNLTHENSNVKPLPVLLCQSVKGPQSRLDLCWSAERGLGGDCSPYGVMVASGHKTARREPRPGNPWLAGRTEALSVPRRVRGTSNE